MRLIASDFLCLSNKRASKFHEEISLKGIMKTTTTTTESATTDLPTATVTTTTTTKIKNYRYKFL
jgi:hypothetical protein